MGSAWSAAGLLLGGSWTRAWRVDGLGQVSPESRLTALRISLHPEAGQRDWGNTRFAESWRKRSRPLPSGSPMSLMTKSNSTPLATVMSWTERCRHFVADPCKSRAMTIRVVGSSSTTKIRRPA